MKGKEKENYLHFLLVRAPQIHKNQFIPKLLSFKSVSAHLRRHETMKHYINYQPLFITKTELISTIQYSKEKRK